MAEAKVGSETIDLNKISSETDDLFDVMDNEEKATKDVFVKGYCLYKHMTNRPPTLQTQNGREKTVVKLLKEESSLNKNFSLSLIETDLQSEQEAKLQDFLIKRLSRSTMYSSSGSLATLSNADISQKPVICYYKLIKGPKLDVIGEPAACSMDFLLCFVVSETSNLYLFQQELERFCKSYEASLSNLVQTDLDTSEIFKDLPNWYDKNILYVCRCTKLFQLELSSLVSMGLLDQSLSVLGCDEQLCLRNGRYSLTTCNRLVINKPMAISGCIRTASDDRFVDVCSLSNLLSAPVVKESNHKLLEELVEKPKSVNKLTFSGSDFKFEFADKEDVCEVCNDWAKTMVEGEQDDPVFLRQVMENYKLKVIQDMNSLKRLLREAETDHYALFRSYLFLLKCPSGRIVMEHIRQEAKMSMTKDICDVIEVLDDFISEKGGFAKIRLRKEQ